MARKTPCRPFNVVDGMILIVAVALSLLLTRALSDLRLAPARFDGFPFGRHINEDVDAAQWIAEEWLAVFSLAFVLIRVRHPRPSLRQLSRQPGVFALAPLVATLSSGLGLGLCAALIFTISRLRLPALESIFGPFVSPNTISPGAVVMALWIGQRASGRWHPEPSWIDRFGRVLAVLWIATFLVPWAFEFFLSTGTGWPPHQAVIRATS